MSIDNYSSITFNAYCEDGDDIWVFDCGFNSLFCIQREDWKVKYGVCIPQESLLEQALVKRIVKVDNKLFLFPDLAKAIYIFDIEKKEFVDSISVFDAGSIEGQTKVSDIYQDGKLIYIIPQYLSQPLAVFDITTLNIRFDVTWNNRILPYAVKAQQCSIYNLIKKEDSIFFVLRDTNYFVKYSISSNEFDIYELPFFEKGYFAVGWGGNAYWCLPYNTSCVVRLSSDCTEQNKIQVDAVERSPLFSGVIELKDEVYFMPARADGIYSYDLEDNSIIKKFEYPEGYYSFSDNRRIWSKVCESKTENNHILFFPCGGNMMIDIDVVNEKIKGKLIDIPEDLKTAISNERRKESIHNMIANKKVIQERDKNDIQFLVNELL